MSVYHYAIGGLRLLAEKNSPFSRRVVNFPTTEHTSFPRFIGDSISNKAVLEFHTGFNMVLNHVDPHGSRFSEINESNLRLLSNNLRASRTFREYLTQVKLHSAQLDHVHHYIMDFETDLIQTELVSVPFNRWINTADTPTVDSAAREIRGPLHDTAEINRLCCNMYLVLSGKPYVTQKIRVEARRIPGAGSLHCQYRSHSLSLRAGCAITEMSNGLSTTVVESTRQACLLLKLSIQVTNPRESKATKARNVFARTGRS